MRDLIQLVIRFTLKLLTITQILPSDLIKATLMFLSKFLITKFFHTGSSKSSAFGEWWWMIYELTPLIIMITQTFLEIWTIKLTKSFTNFSINLNKNFKNHLFQLFTLSKNLTFHHPKLIFKMTRKSVCVWLPFPTTEGRTYALGFMCKIDRVNRISFQTFNENKNPYWTLLLTLLSSTWPGQGLERSRI